MITFTQTGDTLEGPQYIAQFTRGAAVSVTLSDTTFRANEDITNPNYVYSLVWQNSLKKNIAISALSYDVPTNTCTGTVGRAATMCSGLTYVAFAAIDVDANITLTTVAATVDIKRSVDPELGSTEDAESLSDAITNAVSEKAVSSVGYGASDLGKIAVVDKNGNLAVRAVHLLDMNDDDGNRALVLRGAVGQILASITQNELKDLLGVSGSGTTVLDMYPVGSIYQTTSSTFNPQTAWGGTWERIKDRFLLAAGTAYAGGSTGGEATHKLTAQEMPSHTHTMYVNNDGSSSSWSPTAGEYLIKPDGVTTSKKNYQAKLAQNGAGGDQAHNNMPPYLAVYIWKRTA